jgi:hypothetical protein
VGTLESYALVVNSNLGKKKFQSELPRLLITDESRGLARLSHHLKSITVH